MTTTEGKTMTIRELADAADHKDMIDRLRRANLDGQNYVGAAADLIESQDNEINRLVSVIADHVAVRAEYYARITELEKRLEIIKEAPHIDGIYCRDETIRMQEERIAELEKDAERLRRIAFLIGNIFVHGNFIAETKNERELEQLLKDNGTYWYSVNEFYATMQKGK